MFYQSFIPVLNFQCPNCNSQQFQLHTGMYDNSLELQTDADGYFLSIDYFHLHLSKGVITTVWPGRLPYTLTIKCQCANYSRLYAWTNQPYSRAPEITTEQYQATNIYLMQETVIPAPEYLIISYDWNNNTKLYYQDQLLLQVERHYLPLRSPHQIQELFLKLKTLRFYQ